MLVSNHLVKFTAFNRFKHYLNHAASRQFSLTCLKTGKRGDDCWEPRVFSGIQPTGVLHLGNYWGAVRHWIDLQNQGKHVTVAIADLHALTTKHDPESMKNYILELTAYIIACGLDPDKSILFVQSTVPRHAELCWILTTIATHARLAHLPQYKEKGGNENSGLGLLTYPVLQAADVLLHRATLVPVGEDQLQHLQVAHQLRKTFHHRYGHTFPKPEPLLPPPGSARLRSLRDPTKKMSKSDTDPKSRILLSDTPDQIQLKIRKAVTDFTPQVTYDPESRPGVSNLIWIHSMASGKEPEEIVEEVDTLNTLQYKSVVAKSIIEAFSGIREHAMSLLAKPNLIVDILKHGAVRARQQADVTFNDVTELIGTGIPYCKKIDSKEKVKSKS